MILEMCLHFIGLEKLYADKEKKIAIEIKIALATKTIQN